MLVTLSIRDFALIDTLTLDLEEGLNVFTGETGAGKSLIIQAFSLLLGGRASGEIIRRGANRASIDAKFHIGSNPRAGKILENWGIPLEEGPGGGEVIVSRDIGRKARTNKSFLNGRLTPLGALKELGQVLVDLHGQHDHQRLLHASEHLGMLDDFGGKGHQSLVRKVSDLIAEKRKIERELARFNDLQRERLIEMDDLRYRINEIDSVSPLPDEEDGLRRRHRLLSNADRLRGLMDGVKSMLSDEGAVLDKLRSAWSGLDEICEIDGDSVSMRDNYHEALYLLDEVCSDLSARLEMIEVDEEALAEVEERIRQLDGVKRKYGPSIEDVLDYRRRSRKKLDELTGGEAAADEALERLAEIDAGLEKLLPALSDARAVLGGKLEHAVTRHLRQLGMEAATFRVSRQVEKDRLMANGVDRIEFLVAANKGEQAGGLSKIASGGEISRIMLSIKAALASRDRVPIMVFDEIDAGIGGETAWKVAEKLAVVSGTCQCLCITHLAQIAAMADSHYRVSKKETDGRTVISVTSLDEEARVTELARMLGGAGRTAKQHARQLLLRAREGRVKK